jgi:glycosyltransferase involved in cell wall biosynthesis
MSPFLSIIIPVYNVEQYLRDCLSSLLAQTYSDYEVICINDGSTDNSLSILEEYKPLFKNYIIIDAVNGGTASARNIGIRKASGDYVLFLDSDDWLEPDLLEILHKRIQDKPVEILCFNGMLMYEADGSIKQDRGFTDSNLSGWEYYNKYALVPTLFHFLCVVLRIYKRDFLLKNELFFQKGISHEDNLWVPMVLSCAQSVDIIPDSLYVYRIRSGSKMQTVNYNLIEDVIRLTEILMCYFKDKEIDKSVLYRSLSRNYIDQFNMLLGLSLEEEKGILYNKVNWKLFRQSVVDFDVLILYYLLKYRLWKTFVRCYYFDFYIVRKMIRGLKRKLIKGSYLEKY